MPTVVPADGSTLQRALEAAHAVAPEGLSLRAYARLDAALAKTAWGRCHRQRYALVEGAQLLASAVQYDLAAVVERRRLRACGIGSIVSGLASRDPRHARQLVDILCEQAGRDGVAMALAWSDPSASHVPDGFAVVSMMDAELRVTESSRHGAPMTLVRGGEERDLAAIVAMGQIRAEPFRLHLDRDVDFVQYAITKNRLRAGLGQSGKRQLHFFIAEEGITAAAYVVVSVVGDTWTIEECGDRDPSGARVGAILQALIAREPVERRPTIRGWLPPGFLPPQVTIVSATPANAVLLVRSLGSTVVQPPLSGDDVLYWRSDIF